MRNLQRVHTRNVDQRSGRNRGTETCHQDPFQAICFQETDRFEDTNHCFCSNRCDDAGRINIHKNRDKKHQDQKENEKTSYQCGQKVVENNVIDKIYFDVVEPIIQNSLIRARKILDEDAGTAAAKDIAFGSVRSSFTLALTLLTLP